jgi:putative ABC transport system permease protein
VTQWEGNAAGAELPIYRNWVDYEYLDLFAMELVAGRNFSPDHPTDNPDGYLLNEAAVQALGWKNTAAVGRQFAEGRVIGVVKNFHFQPFNLIIEPQFMRLQNKYTSRYGHIAVKIRGDRQEAAIAHLERTMAAVLPLIPYDLHYLDESYRQLYTSERRFAKAFTLFTGLALFIACLGLLGLVTQQVLQRKKEIGVRKVLGASVASLVGLVAAGFLRRITLAALIAAPLAWWGMQHWLAAFAYRIELSAWVFLLVGAGTLLLALVTIGSQSIRAALANPVRAIRSE